MARQFVLAIDQGTTGSTVFLFDVHGKAVGKAYSEFTQHYPQTGWVEHNAEEIWQVTARLIDEVITKNEVQTQELAAIGVTNQRETVVVWDRMTGRPVANAIVWQCRRSAAICGRLRREGHEALFRSKSGLLLDPYFSGTKLTWLFEEQPEMQERARRGELAFGTIDTWLLWKLTGGAVHVTDVTNASRTLMFNIHTLQWDEELLDILGVPAAMLPAVKGSSEIYGYTKGQGRLPGGVPIAGIAGDQQAALFGQACFDPGMVKATYGTGSFILMNTGSDPIVSENGLLTTIAWGRNGEVQYALEGSVFIAGAAVQWLRDELQLITSAAQTEQMALSVDDNGGVYFVPAFVGLGAPYWDSYARGALVGLTRGANRNHIARASLEAIAYQVKDVVDVMVQDSKIAVPTMKVDGGASVNNFILQFQSDMLQVEVERPQIFETTALGAAFLAGLAVGLWDGLDAIRSHWQRNRLFTPKMNLRQRDQYYQQWRRAVKRVEGWISRED